MKQSILIIKTSEGEILGAAINDLEHTDIVNRSITNLMRKHTLSDDVTYDPNESEYTVKTRRGTFVMYVEETSQI
jgi:hypothetical protein